MQRNLMIRILALMLMATLLRCAGCTNKQPEETTPPEESTLPAPTNEDMQIETPYCTMTIPFAFSELVAVQRAESTVADSYVFSAVLEDRSVPVYTIHFIPGDGEMPGELFGSLTTDDGAVRVVYEAFDPDESLQGEDLEAFYTAQETINDVFQSLQAASGFSAA